MGRKAHVRFPKAVLYTHMSDLYGPAEAPGRLLGTSRRAPDVSGTCHFHVFCVTFDVIVPILDVFYETFA